MGRTVARSGSDRPLKRWKESAGVESEMKILAIDTSTLVLGVAVLEEGSLLGEVTTNLRKNHSVRLMPTIARLLEELELKVEDLDGVAVAAGPGSYTGIRIGFTTAKTIAWSRQIPLVPVSSLAALAMNGYRFPGKVVLFLMPDAIGSTPGCFGGMGEG